MTKILFCPLSYGDLIDKISILEIKVSRFSDPNKIIAADRELNALVRVRDEHFSDEIIKELKPYSLKLTEVNEKLWTIENSLRELERKSDFGDSFVRLARSVYKINDVRAALKAEINGVFGSAIIEKKDYGD